MRALVTGGAGYVGALLLADLLDEGYEVTCLDSFMFGYESILHLAHDDNLTLVRADIRDAAAVRHAVKRQDVVYHLAAISGYPACEADPGTAWAVNVDGTRNVVEALDPAQLLVYASSTSIYGPQTLYARSKAAGEDIAMQRANSTAIRWATLFGLSPRMRHELLPNAFTRAAVVQRRIELFSAQQRRTYMHVAHAASDYAWVPQTAAIMAGHVWDVGDSGLTCTKRELAERIAKIAPCSVVINGAPDEDQRDIDVSFDSAYALGLGSRSDWSAHLPHLVRFYSAAEVAA